MFTLFIFGEWSRIHFTKDQTCPSHNLTNFMNDIMLTRHILIANIKEFIRITPPSISLRVNIQTVKSGKKERII